MNVTLFGVAAVSAMMICYALEPRHRACPVGQQVHDRHLVRVVVVGLRHVVQVNLNHHLLADHHGRGVAGAHRPEHHPALRKNLTPT